MQGEVPCSGMHDNMIPCVNISMGNMEYEVKSDFDGEDRVFAMDVVFDLDMKAYEERSYEILADMYGVTKEVATQCKEANFMKLLQKNCQKARVKERIEAEDATFTAILHHEETVTLEAIEIEGSEMTIMGNIHLRCLCTTGDENTEYRYLEKDIPVIDTLEIGDSDGKRISQNVELSVEQMELVMLDSRQIECSGIISIAILVFEEKTEPVITGASVSELDCEKMKNLPGIVIYVVKEGDSLWQIGKEYYISVDAIKEMNGLSKDECRPGEKLLLMKNATGKNA
jgi:hypothetical protein